MLLNLIKKQRRDINKIYLFFKDSLESKYQLLINVGGKLGYKKLTNPKGFIGYSQTLDVVCESLEDYNPTKKRKVLIVFDDIIADKECNKMSPIVTELSLRGRKLSI